VVLLTVLTWAGRRQPNALGRRLEEYRQALLPLAEEFAEVRLARGEAMIPDEERYFTDCVHPNDEGMAVYARNLVPVLREALGKA